MKKSSMMGSSKYEFKPDEFEKDMVSKRLVMCQFICQTYFIINLKINQK